MVRFAHMADCHLGGWKQPELQELNLESFRRAINISIQEKVEFIIIAGDLFDSAYPPIEILKEAFYILSNAKKANIPCYIIAGSHDYSVSGKTFLDVLEKSGFCINVHQQTEDDSKVDLTPTYHEDKVAFYGYPGRKAGMEVEAVQRIQLQPSTAPLNMLLLHTTLEFVKGNLPIEAVDQSQLPKTDYAALGHIHVVRSHEHYHYPGPTFPNNFQELEDLHHGGFYIVDLVSGQQLKMVRYDLPIKKVKSFNIEIRNAMEATALILKELQQHDLQDTIVLLRLRGKLTEGKNSDIRFDQIDQYLKEQKVYCYLKNTSEIKTPESDVHIEKIDSMENVEQEIIASFEDQKQSDFNKFIPALINTLSIEKKEDERSAIFEQRLLSELKTIIPL